MLETSARLLRLLSLLQVRRDWTGPALAERLEVTTRTVRNDIDRLRRLGYPVEASPGVAGGYRLGETVTMPPMLLDDDEAVAVAIALRTATSAGVEGMGEASVRALVKLQRLLPSRLRERVESLRVAAVTLPATGGHVDPGLLVTIAGACRNGERTALRLRVPLRLDERPRHRAVPAADTRRPLVPLRMGPRAGGLADVPRRSDAAADARRSAIRFQAAAAGRCDRDLRRAGHRSRHVGLPSAGRGARPGGVRAAAHPDPAGDHRARA